VKGGPLENKKQKLLSNLSDDISKVELEDYSDKRYREMRKDRNRRLGTNLVKQKLIAKFVISVESSKLLSFLINQFSKLINIPEYEMLEIRFEPRLVDEEAGIYLFQLVSAFKEVIQPVYGSLQYDQINEHQAIVTIIYFGDVNPFLGVPFSAKLYSSIRQHLEYLAVFLMGMLGSDITNNQLLTSFENAKGNVRIKRRRIAYQVITHIYSIYEKNKLDGNKIISPPSVEDIKEQLSIIGIEYSISSIYNIIKQGKEGKL